MMKTCVKIERTDMPFQLSFWHWQQWCQNYEILHGIQQE